MASNLVDLTKLGNALSRFKTKVFAQAQPKVKDVEIGQNVAIASNGGTSISITQQMAGLDFTQVTVLNVVPQYVWPKGTWMNGACVNILTFDVQNGALNLALTTNQAQEYSLTIRIIYLSN